jgi:hypothetical protein
MIVDVHRHDLGRVCDYGSVVVETLAGHEVFLTVHHMTSTIHGAQRTGVTPWQAIAAAFPAARSRRAQAPRDRDHRGARAHAPRAVHGRHRLARLRRRVRAERRRSAPSWSTGGAPYYQAGGGIVVDSKLEDEGAETWSKARAMHAAVSARPRERSARGRPRRRDRSRPTAPRSSRPNAASLRRRPVRNVRRVREAARSMRTAISAAARVLRGARLSAAAAWDGALALCLDARRSGAACARVTWTRGAASARSYLPTSARRPARACSSPRIGARRPLGGRARRARARAAAGELARHKTTSALYRVSR